VNLQRQPPEYEFVLAILVILVRVRHEEAVVDSILDAISVCIGVR
jgi:hypothetical protein